MPVKRSFQIFLLAAVSVLAPGIGPSSGEQKTEPFVIKLATLVPEMGPASELMHDIKKEIADRTEGRLKLIVYFGGVMGDEPDIVRKIRLGQLQGGLMMTLLGLGHVCPALKILELPFLFRNHAEVDHILTTMRSTFARLMEENGAYLVSWSEIGFGYYFFKNPIQSFNDIHKVKMVSFTGDPLFSAAEKTAGFDNLIPLHISETLSGLQTGLVDGTFGPFISVIGLQWSSYANYVLYVPFSYSPGGTFVDKKFFDRIPRQDQEVFFDVMRKSERELGFTLVRKMEREAYEGLSERGLKEIGKEKALAIAEEMEERTRVLYDKFSGKYYPAWLLEEIRNGLNTFRAGKATQ